MPQARPGKFSPGQRPSSDRVVVPAGGVPRRWPASSSAGAWAKPLLAWARRDECARTRYRRKAASYERLSELIRRSVIGSTRAFGAFSSGSSPGGGAVLVPVVTSRYRRRRPSHRRPRSSRVSARLAAVVVLAAGEGTRMKSSVPKVMHELAGRTLIGHAVAAAEALQPAHLVVVVGHGRDQVAEHLASTAPAATIAVQDRQLGTGHAVSCALEALPELQGVVVVTYGDVPLLTPDTVTDLVARHVDDGNAVTVLTAEVDRSHRLRPDRPRCGRRCARHRRAQGREPDCSGDPRDQLGDLRVRRGRSHSLSRPAEHRERAG